MNIVMIHSSTYHKHKMVNNYCLPSTQQFKRQVKGPSWISIAKSRGKPGSLETLLTV